MWIYLAVISAANDFILQLYFIYGVLRLAVKFPEYSKFVRREVSIKILARRRVAVQIGRTGRFRNAVQLDKAHRHHREIRRQIVLAEKRAHRAQQFGGLGVRGGENFRKGALGPFAPMPSVLKGSDLRVGALAR